MDNTPWMIVGLGNPGSKYLLTRHNLGFMVIDYLAKGLGVNEGKVEENCLTCQFKWDGKPVILAKPQNFMNLSGESAGKLSRFYKIPVEQLIVVHDELDLPFGQIKIKTKSGPGGHNGVSSMIEHLGSNEFPRVRIGIGRPPDARMDVANYVLQKFSADESHKLPDILNRAADGVEAIVFDGLLKAMNVFNGDKNGI